MNSQGAPVGCNQQQPPAHKRRKQGKHAEVPHLRRAYAGYPRRPLREQQRQQHAEGRERAVRRNDDTTDVKEDWMHLSQDTAFEQQGALEALRSRIRPTGP